MSIDRSLRTKSSLERHRNVLSRAERVVLLQEEEKWRAEQSPLSLPKVSHRKAKTGKKKAKAEGEGEAAAAAPAAKPAK
jgi:small basic protein (TIGR04137 family)